MTFTDRFHAGRLLAEKLTSYQDRDEVIVLALPRGGVLVGREVAARLHVPLDVLVVRKIGLPEFPEMAIGAIAPGGIKIFSEGAIDYFQLTPEALRQVIDTERKELRRRTHRFRQGRPLPDVRGKVVILVDDGLATGQTMSAAIAWVRRHAPGEIIVAVPVGAPHTCQTLSKLVDRMVCLSAPLGFHAVGAAYLDFRQVTDEEVMAALQQAIDMPAASLAPVEKKPESLTFHGMSRDIPFVKSARIKLSSPQTAEIGLNNGRIVRVIGEAAREPINAISLARESPQYHSTFGLPMEGGGVLVVAVDGRHLDTFFKN